MTARVLDLTVMFVAGLAVGLALAMLLDEVERRETVKVVSDK
jgi:hypothetical protein